MITRLDRWSENPRALKMSTLIALGAFIVFTIGLIFTIILLLIRLSLVEAKAASGIDKSLSSVTCISDAKGTTTFTFTLTDGSKVVATCHG